LSTSPISYEYAGDILKDRIVLVTGASDGIGKALALHIAGLGAQVLLHGRNTNKLEEVYDQITELKDAPRPSIAVLDLATADSDAYASLVNSIEQEFGRLDGLVHNAGILGQRLSIEQYDVADWQAESDASVKHSGAPTQSPSSAQRACRKSLPMRIGIRHCASIALTRGQYEPKCAWLPTRPRTGMR
jgi:NAD(P)-dependent dehydrogenase (short-subunit alcohol dehydrogenase family)